MKEPRCDIEDALLVMDAQDGNAAAMEKLVGRWQKRLWSHTYRLVNSADAAWDITQQSWLGIIKGLNKLHDPESFKAWAYRITTNKAIDWIKKNKNNNQISIEDIRNRPRKEKKQIGLEELFEQLDFEKKLILTLYYFENFDIAEISEAMDIPKGTVKSRLYSARNELKKLYEKESE